MSRNESITELTSARLKKDFRAMRDEYPFSRMVWVRRDLIVFETWGYSRAYIEKFNRQFDDVVTEERSKRILLLVDNDYVRKGATPYALEGWSGLDMIDSSDRHFYDTQKPREDCPPLMEFWERGAKEICPCVPMAVLEMENPLLENVRTVDHLLSAYEQFLKGNTSRVVLREYSHNEEGEREYARERKRKSR